MNRRTALRTAFVFSAGIMVLPSCLQKDEATLSLKNIAVSAADEKMVAQIAETIIPTSNFIGATGLKSHEFILMMVDDCYPPDMQQKYTTGLAQFSKMVLAKYGHAFAACTPQQKKEWLTVVENKTALPLELLKFYQITKQHTLQAFTSCKPFMVDVRKYTMVPGSNFKGCVSLKQKAV